MSDELADWTTQLRGDLSSENIRRFTVTYPHIFLQEPPHGKRISAASKIMANAVLHMHSRFRWCMRFISLSVYHYGTSMLDICIGYKNYIRTSSVKLTLLLSLAKYE